jgi:hypothetical protein
VGELHPHQRLQRRHHHRLVGGSHHQTQLSFLFMCVWVLASGERNKDVFCVLQNFKCDIGLPSVVCPPRASSRWSREVILDQFACEVSRIYILQYFFSNLLLFSSPLFHPFFEIFETFTLTMCGISKILNCFCSKNSAAVIS